jgi:hypothetical protein
MWLLVRTLMSYKTRLHTMLLLGVPARIISQNDKGNCEEHHKERH